MVNTIWMVFQISFLGHELSSLHLDTQARPLAQVITTLVDDYQLPITYAGKLPEIHVSMDCQACPVDQVLAQLFEQVNGSWEKIGSHYLLRFDAKGHGQLQGRIHLKENAEPLVGGDVWLVPIKDPDMALKTRTGSGGWFALRHIPPGSYGVSVQVAGFQNMALGTIDIKAYQKRTVHFKTEMIALNPGEMIVTPGHYQLYESSPALSHHRTRRELEKKPHLANDLLRALGTLPGANRDNLSARPRSYGGLDGEVRIELDGMILRDPFHAKELGGAVSSIDRDTVSGLEWSSGGYTADYGNAIGGVLAIESKSPAERGTLFGLSLTDTNVFHKDVFAEGRGQYFVSARSGNLALVLGMIDFQENTPAEGDVFNSGYFDSFSKIRYFLNENHAISGHFFVATDEVDYGASFSKGEGSYQDFASWINLDSYWREDLTSQTHVGFSDYRDSRVGFAQTLLTSIDYADDREVRNFRVGQRWQWSKSAWEMRGGWYVEDGRAFYDYRHVLNEDGNRFSSLKPESATKGTFTGKNYEVFLAARFRFSDQVVAEIGGRYDYQTWIRKHQWSPRLNLAWTMTPRTQLKLAVGRFHQARQLSQLQVEDGQNDFEPPARAEHYLLGLQQDWGSGFTTRLELFHKPASQPTQRFENLWSPNFLFDQLEADRILLKPEASVAQGAEMSLGWERPNFGSWTLNYTWGKSWDRIDGQKRFRRHDQRHTWNLHGNLRLGNRWFGHLVWNYHSGWRTTDLQLISTDDGFDLELGPINDSKLPAQHRMDVRFSRAALKNKSMSWHIDIINVYDQKNIRGYDDIYINENIELKYEPSTGLPLILSFGINWRR